MFLRLKDKLFYGWVVVAASLIAATVIWGILHSYGVFFKSIESEFNLSRTATSTVYSTYMASYCIFSILGGWASDRYGPRNVVLLMGLFAGLSLLLTSQITSFWQLFIAYSLLLGIGTGAMYAVVMSTVARWFNKKRGLAAGIVSTGGGLGILVMAPSATFLISNYDWRIAYIVIGLVTWLVVIPISRLLRKDPYEIGALPDGLKPDSRNNIENEEVLVPLSDFSLLQAFRTRSFWLLVFIWLLFSTNLVLIMTHLVPHATDIGFSAVQAATVLSLLGAANIPGRILMALVSDRIGRKLTFIICALLQAGAMVWLLWAQDLWMLYMFAFIYGWGYGGLSPVMVTLLSETFGLSNMGIMLGVLEVGYGVGAAIGPIIGGLIFDANSSYFVAFLLGAVTMFIVALLATLVRRENLRVDEIPAFPARH